VTTLDLFPPTPVSAGPLQHLLEVSRIYLEPQVLEYTRGRDILARFPGAERLEVKSHWNIPGLFGNEGNAEAWNRIKGSTLVLGVKKGMGFTPNGRSADFLPPSAANGCVMSCAYCYVPRNKGYANPVSLFVNIEQIAGAIRRHAQKLGPKREPNTVDPRYWVYDIGCNSDCSADAALSDNVRDLVRLFTTLPDAMGSFATKLVNRELLDYAPRGKTRVRFSLMPHAKAKLLDVRTSPIAERIAAIDDFVAAGYEVHLNFSPVVVHEGWQEEYDALFQQVDDSLGPGRQGAARRRGHLPHPQRAPARGEPALAPQGRGAPLAARAPGGQGVRRGRGERALPHRAQGTARARVPRPAGAPHAVLPGAVCVLRAGARQGVAPGLLRVGYPSDRATRCTLEHSPHLTSTRDGASPG
jgi:spore photoproduct lyase family protein